MQSGKFGGHTVIWPNKTVFLMQHKSYDFPFNIHSFIQASFSLMESRFLPSPFHLLNRRPSTLPPKKKQHKTHTRVTKHFIWFFISFWSVCDACILSMATLSIRLAQRTKKCWNIKSTFTAQINVKVHFDFVRRGEVNKKTLKMKWNEVNKDYWTLQHSAIHLYSWPYLMHKLNERFQRKITRIVECVLTKYAHVCARVCCNCAQFKSDFVYRLRICVRLLLWEQIGIR